MVDIVAAKKNIDINEVKYGSSISEATATKIGASINWINNFIETIPLTEMTIYSGPVTMTNAAKTYQFIVPYNMTIKGISVLAGIEVFYSGGAPGVGSVTFSNFLINATPLATGSTTLSLTNSGPSAVIEKSCQDYSSSLGSTNFNTSTNITFSGDVLASAGDIVYFTITPSGLNESMGNISLIYTRII